MKEEFKKFISRGNVMDLAVGVIMGSAFGKIVSSLVSDIIMPIVGIISGGINFTNLSLTIGDANIKYGVFIQNVVDFLIVAFTIFVVIKAFNKITSLRKKDSKEEEKKPVSPKKTNEEKLLEEIRDLLKNNKES